MFYVSFKIHDINFHLDIYLINCKIKCIIYLYIVLSLLLDGKEGVGKTTTLLHLIHYGLVKHFIVVYLPWGMMSIIFKSKLFMKKRYIIVNSIVVCIF